MATFPDPPINAPYPGSSPGYVDAFTCNINIWTYQPERGGWSFYAFQFEEWDAVPLGYYRTPLDYPGIPMFFVVTLRTDGNRAGLPYVLAPQDAPTTQALNCPDGFGLVPVSELNLQEADPSLDHLAPWLVDQPLTELCARLAVQKVPTCPPGTIWDPTTETCKAVIIVPPPVCPPGTQWDLTTLSCKPIKKPPPPVCPPGTQWDPFTETCKAIFIPPPPGQPCVPIPSQWDDELTAGLNCISENLIVIQQLLQQQKQGSEPPQLDPVTCTQLSYLVGLLDTTLIAIARAIQTATGNPQPPIDLTPITNALTVLAHAIATPLTAIEQSLTGVVPPPKLPPDLTTQINQILRDALADIPSTSSAAQLLT